jgi:DNA-binding IclR family transcriptional regulator
MGTFLESLQQKKASQVPSAPTMKLLDLLSAGPRPVADLQKESGIEFSEFSTALNSLVDADFVALSGQPSEETAALTTSGAALVAMKS